MPQTLTLQEAADALGVHYMTAYRYVRLGLIEAAKVGSAWQVPRSEVDRLLVARKAGDAGEAGPRGGRAGEPAPWSQRLEARLRAGDVQGSWGVVAAALAAGVEPDEVYLELISPAMRNIGEAWAVGEIDVGVEHRASAIVMRMIGRLGPRFNRRGQSRGAVVLGAPAGDRHSLPAALFGDLVRGAGFDVVDLGADTPVAGFVSAARHAQRLVAVAVGVTTPDNEASVRALTAKLHDALPEVTVLVGGGAVADEAHARSLGADGWAPDPLSALTLLEEVAATSGSSGSTGPTGSTG